MGTANQTALCLQPDILELFQVLESNGMKKELQEVGTLVEYLENMESKFGEVLSELQEVKTQLAQMEDKGIAATTTRMVEKAEDKIQEIGDQFAKVKSYLIQSAKYAVSVFREKGTEALRSAVSAMKVPAVLSALKESLHSGMENMDKSAKKMESVGNEFHAMGGHLKNIGRILIGKERKEPEQRNPDKGILAKVQKAFLMCGRRFSEMEKQTENTLKKVEKFRNGREKKPSVKREIQQIKSERSAKLVPSVQPSLLPAVIQDKAR